MSLNATERLLVEAINSMLRDDAKLGLADHEQAKDDNGEHGYQYLHEQINDLFVLRAAELNHAESVTSSFRKVHNYKYLSDWTFIPAMEREMVSRAVPREERLKALEFIPKIIEELQTEQKTWSERDAGLNPRLDEVRKASQPKQSTKLKIHDRPGQKRNVEKPTPGDGSPARTNNGRPPLPSSGHDADINPD